MGIAIVKKTRLVEMSIFARIVAFFFTFSLSLEAAKVPKNAYSNIPALGHSSRLGDLYDARNAQFININIFKTLALPNSTLTSLKKPSTEIHSKIIENYEDKFNLLNIDPNTAVNFLSGLVNLEDSSSVLNDMRKDEDEVTALLLHKLMTVVQDLQIYADDLKPLYIPSVLSNEEELGTHVITGITWGVHVAITLKGTACKYKNMRQIRTEIEAELDTLKEGPSANHSIEKKTNFSISINSDISLPLHKPTTHRQVHQLFDQLPTLLEQHYEGKGVPISYHLTPLRTLQSYLEIEVETPIFTQKLNDYTLRKFYRVFDEIFKVEQILNNLKTKLGSNTKCLKEETQDNFNNILDNFVDFKGNFKSNLRDALVEARSGTRTNTTELTNLANRFRISEYSGVKFRTSLKDFDDAVKKIEWCNNIRDNYEEIEYFTSENRLISKMLQNINRTVYILFLKNYADKDAEEGSHNQLSTFLNDLYFAQKENTLFIVDCDFHFSMCRSVNKTVIREVIHGNIESSDFLGSLKDREDTLKMQINDIRILLTDTTRKINITLQDNEQEILGLADDVKNIQNVTTMETEKLAGELNSVNETLEQNIKKLGKLQEDTDINTNEIEENNNDIITLEFALENAKNATLDTQQNINEQIQVLQTDLNATNHMTESNYAKFSILNGLLETLNRSVYDSVQNISELQSNVKHVEEVAAKQGNDMLGVTSEIINVNQHILDNKNQLENLQSGADGMQNNVDQNSNTILELSMKLNSANNTLEQNVMKLENLDEKMQSMTEADAVSRANIMGILNVTEQELNNRLSAEIQKWNLTNHNMTKQIRDLYVTDQDLSSQVNQNIQTILTLKFALENSTNATTNIQQNIREQLRVLQTDLHATQNMTNDQHIKSGILSSQLDTLIGSFHDSVQNISQLQNNVKHVEEVAVKIEKDVLGIKSDIVNVNQDIRDNENQIETLQSGADEMGKSVDRNGDTILGLRLEMNSANLTLQQHVMKLETIQNKTDSNYNEIEKNADSMQKLDEKIQSLNEEYAVSRATILEALNVTEREINDRLSAEIQQWNQANENVTKKIGNLQATDTGISRQVDQSIQDILTVELALANAKNATTESQQNINTQLRVLQTDLNATRYMTDDTYIKSVKLSKELNSTNNTLQKNVMKLEKIQEDMESNAIKIQNNSNGMESLNVTGQELNDRLSAGMEQLNETHRNLTRQISNLQVTEDDLGRQVDQNIRNILTMEVALENNNNATTETERNMNEQLRVLQTDFKNATKYITDDHQRKSGILGGQLDALNRTFYDSFQNISKLENSVKHVDEMATKSMKDIHGITSEIINVNRDIRNNKNHLGNILGCLRLSPRILPSLNRRVSDINTLGCGGIIKLPSKGSSVLVEYKSTSHLRKEERCLWTLDSSHNGRRFTSFKLKVTILCDGFSKNNSVITLHSNTQELSTNRNSVLSSYQLKRSTAHVSMSSGAYLSLTTSNQTLPSDSGFVIQIDVVDTVGDSPGSNLLYTASPASFEYGPYTTYEQVALLVIPPESQRTTLTVDYVRMKQHPNCALDKLAIYELSQEGAMYHIARLCGNHTGNTTVRTKSPILVIFTSNGLSNYNGFKISWH